MNTAQDPPLLSALPLFLLRCDAPSTRTAYEREVHRFVAWLGPNPPRVGMCEKYVAYLRGRGLSPTTVRWRATVAASFLRSAHEQGELEFDPTAGFKPPKGASGFAPRFLTKGQLKRLLAAPDRRTHAGKRDLAILACLGVGGLRAGEVCRLSRSDVEDHGDRILLRVNGKGRKVRLVPLSSLATPALRSHLRACGIGGEGVRPVFRNVRGGRLTTGGINHLLAKACYVAALPKITAHTLRHTAATLAIESGVGLHTVRDQLGHSSVLVTSRYLHVV